MWQMVQSGMGMGMGMGVGVAMQFVAGQNPELQQVLAGLDIAPMPVWPIARDGACIAAYRHG